MKNKIIWLSVLQGWAVLLVVLGHIILSDIPQNPNEPIAAWLEYYVYQYHMALFIFISGYLFSLTNVNRNVKRSFKEEIQQIYLKKSKRILIPMFFFTIVALLLKWLASSLVKRKVEMTFVYFIGSFINPMSGPLLEMWFLMVLCVLFFLSPLYFWADKSKIREVALWTIFLFLALYPIPNITTFCLSRSAGFIIYFYSGLLVQKYFNIEKCSSITILIVTTLLMLIFNCGYYIKVVSVFTGIIWSVFLCVELSKILPSLFSSFRDYLMQIFLMGIFFQMLIRWINLKLGIDWLYVPLFIISIVVGIYMPVLIAKLLKKYLSNYPRILLCFGL